MGAKLGQKFKKWTDEDTELLKSLYLFMTDEELAKLLKRKRKTISAMRDKLGLYKKNHADFKKIAKRVPIIVIKDRNKFDEDLLKLKDLL